MSAVVPIPIKLVILVLKPNQNQNHKLTRSNVKCQVLPSSLSFASEFALLSSLLFLIIPVCFWQFTMWVTAEKIKNFDFDSKLIHEMKYCSKVWSLLKDFLVLWCKSTATFDQWQNRRLRWNGCNGFWCLTQRMRVTIVNQHTHLTGTAEFTLGTRETAPVNKNF